MPGVPEEDGRARGSLHDDWIGEKVRRETGPENR